MKLVFYIDFVILLIFISRSFQKEFIIKNDTNLDKLQTIVNDNQSNDDELVLRFVDPFYNMRSLEYSIEFTVLSNITFIGNPNGTIFNYNNYNRGTFKFTFSQKNYDKTLKMENIIFEEFAHKNNNNMYNKDYHIINVVSHFFEFRFIIQNCTFRNNKLNILSVSVAKNNSYYNDTSVYINQCNF